MFFSGRLFLCFGIGMPISYALGFGALVGALWIGIPPEAVMLKISDGVSKVAMLTIPFFVLAGAIMAEGGMAQRLVKLANVIVGVVRVRGGLSAVNILATTFLSGISGSSVADVSAIGSVLIPQMEKVGYPRVFATNVTISASLQAIVVPPSHNAVIYSLATGGTISIISLFMAGVVPGLLLGVCAGRAVHFHRLSRRPSEGRVRADPRRGQDHHRRRLGPDHGLHHHRRHPARHLHRGRSRRGRLHLGLLRDHVHLPRLPLEGPAGAGASHAQDGRHGDDADRDGVVSFGYVMALMQLPAKITAFFLSVSENKYVILMLINFMLLVLGCLMDMAPLILICTPILLPVVMKLGVDPVHFGMIMLMNLGIGLLTPPVGSVLFVGCAIGNVRMEDVMRTIWPFYGVMFVVLMLVTFIPALSLWLPALVIK